MVGNKKGNYRTLIKKIFSKKRLIEYFLPLLLLILGLVTYLVLTNRKEKLLPPQIDIRDQAFINAIYQYRLENLDRAEILFTKILEDGKMKKRKSLATLYLGNIYFKRGNYVEAIDFYERSISYSKNNVFAMYNASIAHFNRGEVELALEYALKAYNIKDDFLLNRLFLGNVYYAADRYDKAIPLYRHSHELEGEKIDEILTYNLAVSYLQIGDVENTVKLLHNIINDVDSYKIIKGMSLYTLANLEQNDDIGKAVQYLRDALVIFPSSYLLRYNLASMLLKVEEYEEAATLLKSIKGGVKEKEVNELLGFALFKSGHYKMALDFYKEIYGQTENTEISYIMGDIYVNLDDLEMAKIYYKNAIVNPKNEEAFINLINIYLEGGVYKEAMGLCYDYMKQVKENPLPYICLADIGFTIGNSVQARADLETAVMYSKNDIFYLSKIALLWKKYGLYNNALYIFYKIVSIDPTYYDAFIQIADIYLTTGHIDKARSVLLKIRDRIEDINLYYSISMLLAQSESTDRALSIYRELTRDFPYRYEGYYNLSILYIENEEYDSAIHTVEECIKRISDLDDSILSNLYSILGCAELKLGNVNEASKEFFKASTLDSSNEIPLMNLKSINE